MFKRVKSVFKRDGREGKEKKPKEPKEKRKGFLRRRGGGRVAESEVLPPAHDSRFIPPSHDGESAYHPDHRSDYTHSITSNDHPLLAPPPGARSIAPSTVLVPPPTVGSRSAHQQERFALHDFPRVSLVPSTGGTHIAYPSSRTTGPNLSGPSAMSRGRTASRRSVDMPQSIAGSEDGPPLPVPPRGRVGTNASRGTRGMHDVHTMPTSARTRSVRNRSASGSRSRSGERLRAHSSMRSRTGRAATRDAPMGGQAPHAANGHGDLDRSGLFNRIKNLYSLEHPDFGFSRCTGKRKAVCIGINYTGSSHSLDGCVEDAKRMYKLLTKQFNFSRDQVVVLTDDADERNKPTHKNIMNAMRWLVEGAEPHDSLFIHYSGHGGQIQDQDGDEVDGLDEMIFPVDYEQSGIILDDLLHDTMIRPLPPACRLTAVFDSCHSGSILDLVYLYHSDGRIMGTDVTPKFKERKMTPAEVICWSGSADAGTSADADINGLQVGAMSYAFTRALKANPRISFADLLRDLRRHTKRYNQRPQLSASHRINMMRTFRL